MHFGLKSMQSLFMQLTLRVAFDASLQANKGRFLIDSRFIQNVL
jgi:hypothetical protein